MTQTGKEQSGEERPKRRLAYLKFLNKGFALRALHVAQVAEAPFGMVCYKRALL